MKTKKDLKADAMKLWGYCETAKLVSELIDRLPDDPPRRALYTVRAGDRLPEMPAGAKVVSIAPAFQGGLLGGGLLATAVQSGQFSGGYEVAITVELPE